MAGVPPKKNTAYTFYTGLEDKANPGLFKASPTLAAGDWKIAIDDGAPANLATLPVVDADFTKRVKVALSADEMNGDHITIIASDAAGAEWYDLQINIDTDAKQIGDIPAAAPSAATIAGAVLDEAKGAHTGHIAAIPTNPYTGTPPTPPSAATIGNEIWTGTYTRQINSVLGTVDANVTQMNGDTDPVDNLVLALGNSSGVMISNAAVDAVWDEAIAGHLTAGTTGAKLNTAAAASGSGSTVYTDTVTDDSSNPLDGVEVWITSDSGGASTVASTTTNTLGAFTVYLDPGTYYLWLAKGGYNFPNPTTITVS